MVWFCIFFFPFFCWGFQKALNASCQFVTTAYSLAFIHFLLFHPHVPTLMCLNNYPHLLKIRDENSLLLGRWSLVGDCSFCPQISFILVWHLEWLLVFTSREPRAEGCAVPSLEGFKPWTTRSELTSGPALSRKPSFHLETSWAPFLPEYFYEPISFCFSDDAYFSWILTSKSS